MPKKPYTKKNVRKRLCESLLNLYDFMKETEWNDINNNTFKSFRVEYYYTTVLIKGGIIEKRQNGRQYQYKWAGPRPSMSMVNKMANDYLTKRNNMEDKKQSIIKVTRTMSFQDKEGITWYREIEVSCSENNGYLLCAFPTNLANKILTLTGMELLLQD